MVGERAADQAHRQIGQPGSPQLRVDVDGDPVARGVLHGDHLENEGYKGDEHAQARADGVGHGDAPVD